MSMSKYLTPVAWAARFKASTSREVSRGLLREIWQQTVECCNAFQYLHEGGVVSLGTFESVAAEAQKTQLHAWQPGFRQQHQRCFEQTTVTVVNNDCLEEAMKLKLNEGFNPGVLNMASHLQPGGSVADGSPAQEENLFRRSNYFQHLANPDKRFDKNRQWTYPLAANTGVYSSNVLVFRGSQALGYPFLPQPVPFGMIAAAAIYSPQTQQRPDGDHRLNDRDAELTLKTIELVLQMAFVHGHDSLVLSAFGCGAFRNPPRHMAELFGQVLKEYDGFFRKIVFAIVDDQNAGPEGNVKPFQNVMLQLQPPSQ